MIKLIGFAICLLNFYYELHVESHECSDQTWGPRCNKTCHCASGTCHYVNGSCDSGCADGWTGPACQVIKQEKKSESHLAMFILGSVLGLSLFMTGLLLFLWIRLRIKYKLPKSGSRQTEGNFPNEIIHSEETRSRAIYENVVFDGAENMKEEGQYEELRF